MGNILQLATLLECEPMKLFTDPADSFNKRDEIKKVPADHLLGNSAIFWLTILEKADIWCASVMDYDKLVQQDGYKILDMEIKVKTSKSLEVITTRCPIRVDGKLLISDKGAPQLGEHNDAIDKQFKLEKVFQEK